MDLNDIAKKWNRLYAVERIMQRDCWDKSDIPALNVSFDNFKITIWQEGEAFLYSVDGFGADYIDDDTVSNPIEFTLYLIGKLVDRNKDLSNRVSLAIKSLTG